MTVTSRTIEFLYLDNERCGRCADTEAHLREAMALAAGRLGPGVTLQLNAVHITSAEAAAAHRLASSPTIRVDGRDVAPRIVETPCEAEACSCADGTPIDCRMWEWDGTLHSAPPVELLVEAIVDPPRDPVSRPPDDALPANLARFFAAEDAGCCAPAARQACCEPPDTAECCGPADDGCGC